MFKNENPQSVCKIPCERGVELIIKTVWDDCSFNIALLEGDVAYRGIVTKDKITELSSQLGITCEDYINQCKIALSSNGGDKHFVYILENNLFQWKKINYDMKITFGTINLSSVPVIETFHDFMDVSINNNYNLIEKVSKIEQERDILKTDNRELLQKISDCLNLKSDAENQLYSQFLMILNAKKRKIAQLEKQLKSNGSEVAEDEIEDEEEKSRLYECDTEVETDDSNDGGERETAKEISGPSKNDVSLTFDSDPDTKPVYNIPKRNKKNKKSSDNNKTLGSDGSETLFSGDRSNIFKQSNSYKRLSNKKEIEYCDEAGPSRMKLSKTTGKEKSVKKVSKEDNNVQSKDKLVEFENDDKNRKDCVKESENSCFSVLLSENKKSPSRLHTSKSTVTINSRMDEEANGSRSKLGGNIEQNSSVDDLISNLLM